MIMIASALTIECTSQRSAVPSILALISDSWAEFPELRHRRTELVLGSYENDLLVASTIRDFTVSMYVLRHTYVELTMFIDQ